MRGVLLDKRTGRPEYIGDVPDKGILYKYVAPDHVLENLRKAEEGHQAFQPRGSMQSWEETLYAPLADGAAVTSATESIMVPDFTLPPSYLYPGRILKWTVMGRVSTVITTPGVITLALRWGGVAGTVLATSGGFAPDPTAASTNLTMMVEWWMLCRAVGTSAASIAWGRIECPDIDDATTATLKAEYDKRLAPAATPAAVNINTTVANALTPTFDQSVATGSFTAHVGILEAVT